MLHALWDPDAGYHFRRSRREEGKVSAARAVDFSSAGSPPRLTELVLIRQTSRRRGHLFRTSRRTLSAVAPESPLRTPILRTPARVLRPTGSRDRDPRPHPCPERPTSRPGEACRTPQRRRRDSLPDRAAKDFHNFHKYLDPIPYNTLSGRPSLLLSSACPKILNPYALIANET